MEKQTLTLTREQAIDILCGDSVGFEIIQDDIIDQGRWTTGYVLIIKRENDGLFFLSYYEKGSTEYQDNGPWEGQDEVEFIQVFPKEKTITIYE